MCWALLWPIQVSFQVQVGPKMGVFWSKIAKITGCHIERRKQPGNRIMGQNTHRAMGIVMLGTFLPYPGGNKHDYYWSIISRIKFWRFSFFSEIVFWKNIRFFRVTILGLVYPNSTQTFEDLYSLTRLEKAPGSFIRGLYFHKMGTMIGMMDLEWHLDGA